MTFLCLVLAYSMRVNLSVGIVAMTNSKDSNPDFMVLPWSTTRQGIILSSFFWGYLITQIPAGHMARKFGPKYLLFGAMLVCSVFTLLSPFIAENCSWMYFCLTRVVQGLAQETTNVAKTYLSLSSDGVSGGCPLSLLGHIVAGCVLRHHLGLV
ncbi:hypothetical protein J6590_061692 [Homalodisca vitripennis]|nr:hypothetical protein J6590_061692 [Homalodisca vitripennis]